MGMNMIITLIMGITMSTILGTAIAPSIIEQTKINRVNTQTINNQEVIFEAIKRYTTMKQEAPEDMDDLFKFNYIDSKVNDNGFGGTYDIKVEKDLGVATITTTIDDPKAQEAFLKSFKGISKPTRVVDTTNKFETKYVIPNDIMHGNALLMTGIPIGSTSPDSDTNKYWYDTSSGKAVLKLYDNDSSKWTEVNLGNSPEDNLKFIAGDLPIFTYSYVLPETNPYYNYYEKTFLEIIPSKLGSFKIKHKFNGGISKLFVYINGIKQEPIFFKPINGDTFDNATIIFFKAYDKIEFKFFMRIDDFQIHVTPESAGLPDLKITKFIYH